MLAIVIDSVKELFIWIWKERVKIRRIWVAIAQLQAPAQERFKSNSISRSAEARPCWCSIYQFRFHSGTEDVLQWLSWQTMNLQNSHGIDQLGTWGQQSSYMIGWGQPVINYDPKSRQLGNSSIFGNGGGNYSDLALAPRGLKMISLDLATFILRLLSSAHAWMCFNSSALVSSLAAGTTKYVSSAYLMMTLPVCRGYKSAAVTT